METATQQTVKASELRLGNYISFNGKIDMVSSIEYLVDVDGKKEGYIIDGAFEEDLQPIPLTKEVLVKCGFKKDPKGGHPYFDVMLQGGRRTKLRGFFMEDIFCTLYHNERFVDLQCLHQLQNLYFALTGTELEINL